MKTTRLKKKGESDDSIIGIIDGNISGEESGDGFGWNAGRRNEIMKGPSGRRRARKESAKKGRGRRRRDRRSGIIIIGVTNLS